MMQRCEGVQINDHSNGLYQVSLETAANPSGKMRGQLMQWLALKRCVYGALLEL